ncbi:MAG: lysylphosphatidylglycerol synthase transmembrane domain-containing protein [Acidimicrobiia bacterium]|nr:MAG: lysylphosphatidylglycerol synthase transmembrane domain-containing protein [Acidimicrobiia bacterium]
MGRVPRNRGRRSELVTSRYFANEPGQPRVRRAADATLTGLGLLLVFWTAINADRVAAVESALIDLAGSVPLWFDQFYEIAYFLGLLLIVGLVVSVLAQGFQRLDLLRDMALAIFLSIGIAILVVWLIDGGLPTVLPEFAQGDAQPAFPILRVAVLTAAVVVASPHLTRAVRLFGWLMIVIVAISGFGLGLGLPGDALGGFGLGLAVAGSVLLMFGSPAGYPDPLAVASALTDFGITVLGIEPTRDQSWGVRRLMGSLDDGTSVEIKAYGRDAMDSQLFARVWRTVWYREGGETFSYNRLQAVEHEALALLTTRRHGVSVSDVLAVGVGGDDIALLATVNSGDEISEAQLTREMLVAIWGEVASLHDAGIAHGALTLDAFGIVDDGPVLRNLGAASLSATDVRLSLDVVSLLYSTAVAVGTDDAVTAARSGIEDASLTEALPFLQPPALSRAQRQSVPKPKALVAEIRDAIAEATETELPEPGKLRRVEWKNLIMPALSLVAAYALIGMLSDIDFAAVWDVVEDATWAWIILGFFVGQMAFIPEATGMLFATGIDLPLKPLVILQVSVKWIGLAVPSAAGRVAMNTLFLRKFGVSPTIALTQGALDGLAGFVVEAGVLLVAFVASDLSLDLDATEVNWQLILLIVGLLVVGSVVAVLRIDRLRELVVPALKDAWGLLWSILKDPKRTFGLLGSNLASRVILAGTLWFILHAIGAPLSFVAALVATLATNLLAGLVPIPGGIGVAEAVLTSFLIVFGLSPEQAFAVAVIFRIATFYIPAAEGFVAMKWLEANGHL